MSSTPQTGGFQVGVMPGFQLANPAFFNPYGALSQGLSSGVNMGAQLADVFHRAQQYRQEQALAPLRTQLLQAQLAQAQQKAAVPDIIWGDTTDVDTSKAYPKAMEPVLDEKGEPVLGGDGQPMFKPSEEAPDIEYGDIVRHQKGIKYLPGGLTEPVEKTSTVKLAAEREAEANTRESLIASREAAAKAAQDRLDLMQQLGEAKNEALRIRAEADLQRATALSDNPNYQHRYVVRDGKKFIQYFRKDDPTKVVHEVDAGLASSNIFAPGAIFNGSGAQPGVGGAPAQTNSTDTAAADLAAALSGKYGTQPAQVVAPAPAAQAPQAAAPAPVMFRIPTSGGSQLPVVKTKDEWDALPAGSSYLGVDGKTYIKRK